MISEKRALKLKAMESQNSSPTAQLEDSRAKVSQLEDQCFLCNNLIDAGKKNALLTDQVKKSAKDFATLKKELSDCKAEKANLTGKLKMEACELVTANASLDRMNKQSKKLDDILSSQVLDSGKHGTGNVHKLFTSKSKRKFVFVQGPTMYSMTPRYPNTTHLNTANKRTVPKPRFILVCHFCGIKGHVRPHCNKLRNRLRNQRRKTHYSSKQVNKKSL